MDRGPFAMSLVLLNAVGLTPRLLPHAPRLHGLARAGWVRPLREVVPAVTCTAQATLLAGRTPAVQATNPIGCNVKWSGKDAHWMPKSRADFGAG